MFGPDLCGYDVSRIHAIFNHEGENLLKDSDVKLEYGDKNEFTHLYTLHVKADNTYTVYFDMEEKASGSLHDDWAFPKKQIDDPEDKKPSDWVDEKKIPTPRMSSLKDTMIFPKRLQTRRRRSPMTGTMRMMANGRHL